MGVGKAVGDRLRERIVSERERHGWSQVMLAAALNHAGCYVYASTIAKIETGARAIQVSELAALADVFGVSVDALLGRNAASDVAWAASKLTANAQKMAGDIAALEQRLVADLADIDKSSSGRRGEVLRAAAVQAMGALQRAREGLLELARQFPLPKA